MGTILEAIILGLIQGLTEFIPVSSSGHLVVAQNFLTGASEHLFLQFINIGTLLALLVFFRRRIMNILKSMVIDKNIRLARNIFITALPAGIIGFLLSDLIESSFFFGSSVVVAVTLFLVGAIMILLEKLPKASHVADGEQLSAKRAFFIGTLQVFSLVPGVSRSGATIIAGRLSGLNPASSAEYSFLVALPVLFGVALKTFVADKDYLMDNMQVLLWGNVFAFVAGLLAVSFLMRYLANHSLAIFGWYRIALSAALVVILLIQ